MKRRRGAPCTCERHIEGACFLAWRDVPPAGAAGGSSEPALCVGELHFSNATHLPDDTPLESLYGVLFQLRATPQGLWTHDGGDPWRVVPMAATVAARLVAAPKGNGIAWALADEEEVRDRLESLAEPAPRVYVPAVNPSPTAVVGAA